MPSAVAAGYYNFFDPTLHITKKVRNRYKQRGCPLHRRATLLRQCSACHSLLLRPHSSTSTAFLTELPDSVQVVGTGKHRHGVYTQSQFNCKNLYEYVSIRVV